MYYKIQGGRIMLNNKKKLKNELNHLKLKERGLRIKFERLCKEIKDNSIKIILIENKLSEEK